MCLCREKYSERWRHGYLIPVFKAALYWERMLGKSTHLGLPCLLLNGFALRMPANPVPVHFQPARLCFLPYLLFPFSLHPLVQ